MGWGRRLINVFRSDRLSRDLDRELEFHIAERADDLRAAGLADDDAQREARRRLGNYTLQKERTRDMDVMGWLDTIRADIRYAARALRASPGFALVAIVSLALGIGANTAIFSLIDAVVLKPLPVERPEQLVLVTRGEDNVALTNPLWEALRDRQDVFTGMAAYAQSTFNLADGGEVRPVRSSYVSGDFFRMLGVRPAAGRLLSVEDDYRGCPGVAVLGAGFWQSEFGGSRDVIGRTVPLDGKPFVIIGVADARFPGVTVGREIAVYAPLCAEAVIAGPRSGLDNRSRWFLQALARRDPGMSVDATSARLAALAPAVYDATVPDRYEPAEQDEYRKGTFAAIAAPSGTSTLRDQYSPALVMLMGLVAVVLLIACGNVANLLLARASVRQREIAVRVAIGAGRARIVRQLLTESLLLAFLSALLGVAFAWWGSRTLVALLATSGNSVVLELPLDVRMLGFTLVLATVAAILFGVAPAWRAGRSDPQSALRANARGIVSGHSRINPGKVLVTAQIALSLALVVAAGLLLGTFRTLSTAPAGFDATGVLLASVSLPADVNTFERQRVVYPDLLARLRVLPGVESVSASERTPIGNSRQNNRIFVDGYTPATPREAVSAMNEVADGYFATLGTRILAGREFDGRDVAGAPVVAVVNEAFARHYFGSTDVLGREFRVSQEDARPYRIIGVVENAKYQSLREEPQPIGYLAWAQAEERAFDMTFSLRVRGAPSAVVPGVREAAHATDPTLSLRFTPFAQQLADSLARERMLAVLSGFFGALALLLAMIGLYGIMAYSVARRRNEIGIRMALGSARGRVLRMVLGEAGWMVALGLVAGVALALLATRVVASFLYGLAPTDARTMLASAVLLAVIGLGASALPAWRASRVEPMTALRDE